MSVLKAAPDRKIESPGSPSQAAGLRTKPVEAALLTGGTDRHYAYGLAMSLASSGVCLDVVGGADIDGPEMRSTSGLTYLSLRKGWPPGARLPEKIASLAAYYIRLIAYAWTARPKIFHILWNNRFELIDRTLLMLYYKSLGKKIAFTAHNVNAGRRDSNDSLLNRLTLRVQYRLADKIFVHTARMKHELIESFGVREQAVTVIPYGINNAVPCTSLTPAEAKEQLGISKDEKTILFFGNLRASKGLEFLVRAFQRISSIDARYRLIIAGRRLKGYEEYWAQIEPEISSLVRRGRITLKADFIPDEEVELYFKAADVLALPYTEIFQSGVLFLGLSFGVPVIATDVGSLREEIVEGRTGYVCKPRDAVDLARAIETYFESKLFKNLDSRRNEIQDYANASHSWDSVAEITHRAYSSLAG
ncbi:MAG TPA: glycosyltransferase family 4 protein [Terriglobia bacterium]|nr:glycosyltransferase family 4 protein [Terriglobia bacterium]